MKRFLEDRIMSHPDCSIWIQSLLTVNRSDINILTYQPETSSKFYNTEIILTHRID